MTKVARPPPAAKPGALTAARAATHGAWRDTADATERLKEVLGELDEDRACRGQPGLTPQQRQALVAIVGKIARILSGDPNHPDHWDDIAGYAQLGKGEASE